MRIESALFQRTRLRRYHRCLEMLQAYANLAPWWERLALAAYCGVGTWVAGCFGVDTLALWGKGESILEDVFAASQCSPQEIAELLRQHVRIRLKASHAMPFEEAKVCIYDQLFYPIAAHIAFAMQPSAGARLRFVTQAAVTSGLEQGCVADLGCGPGVMLSEILLSRPRWTGCGLDISQSTVNYARRLAGRKGVGDRAQFRVGDVSDLPYATGSMDLVVASEVLEHVPDIARALHEVARVLRPGGRAAITLPMETHTPAHLHSVNKLEFAHAFVRRAGMTVVHSEVRRERVRYGDDPAHLFLLAETRSDRTTDFLMPPVFNADRLAPPAVAR